MQKPAESYVTASGLLGVALSGRYSLTRAEKE
jgi:hypothetical protein